MDILRVKWSFVESTTWSFRPQRGARRGRKTVEKSPAFPQSYKGLVQRVCDRRASAMYCARISTLVRPMGPRSCEK